MSQQDNYSYRSLYHGWLPANPEVHKAFLRKHVLDVLSSLPADKNGWATEFINTIKANPTMKALLDNVFRQVNTNDKWAPSDAMYRVRDIDHLQAALTSVTQGPPEVYVVEHEGKAMGEPIGIPIYLILDLLINTGAAYDLFRMKEFNDAMKTFLGKWGDYLMQDKGSNSTLTQSDSGWFGNYALKVLENGLQGKTFEQTYGVDPAKAQQSYETWDAFFIRPFVDIKKLRPVLDVSRFPAIYNACESTSLRTVDDVQLHDTFWLKSQNYSLYDMFGGDPVTTPNSLSAYAEKFVGGSVYQAFLAPQDYHHWHSPIQGTVLETTVLPGTYYAALPDDGASQPVQSGDLQEGDPHGALMRSQPWLSIAAARGVVIIKPDDTSPLELAAVIAIGMVEVSTIDIRVSKDGSGGKPNKLEAGDELGMFHFGGSSHCVILKPKKGYHVEFKDINDYPVAPNQHHWVRSVIGRVVSDQ